MIRLAWCFNIVVWPLLLFSQPVAIALSTFMLWAAWEFVAADRNFWRHIARTRKADRNRDHEVWS